MDYPEQDNSLDLLHHKYRTYDKNAKPKRPSFPNYKSEQKSVR